MSSLSADLVPFGDPYYYQDWKSPYYNASHFKLRSAMRRFTDEHLSPFAAEWDQAREIPPEAYKKIADFGILAAIAAGATGWPTEYAQGIPVPGGVDPDKFDAFHGLIVVDEMCRCASGGILYGVLGGFGISINPLRDFGSDELKRRILPALLKGEKRSCLAITEPEGGSDVANIVTTAKKSDDGQYFIVEGAKKWITKCVPSLALAPLPPPPPLSSTLALTSSDPLSLPRPAVVSGATTLLRPSVPAARAWAASRSWSSSAARASRRARWTARASSRAARPTSRTRTCVCPSATCSARRTRASRSVLLPPTPTTSRLGLTDSDTSADYHERVQPREDWDRYSGDSLCSRLPRGEHQCVARASPPLSRRRRAPSWSPRSLLLQCTVS